MTKKQIVNTIGWTVIVFAILASYRYYIGVDNWVEETLNWVIPAAVGYFLGYGQAQKRPKTVIIQKRLCNILINCIVFFFVK